jgi:hypothetical protein
MPKIKQIKYSQELTFLVAAVLILIILVMSVSLILGFLISRLNIILNPNVLEPPTVVQFNIEEFERLDLAPHLF